MTKKIETLEPKFYGNDVDTFVKLPNGLIFLVSSIYPLDDGMRVDRLPRDVVEISNPGNIKTPDWIWHEMVYVVTSSETSFWELTGARTVSGAKKVCTNRFGDGPGSAILLVGMMDGSGRIFIIARRGNYPGAQWQI